MGYSEDAGLWNRLSCSTRTSRFPPEHDPGRLRSSTTNGRNCTFNLHSQRAGVKHVRPKKPNISAFFTHEPVHYKSFRGGFCYSGKQAGERSRVLASSGTFLGFRF